MSKPTQGLDHDHFDALVRQRHAESLHMLSPRVRAQLAQRRNAVLRIHAAHRGHGLRVGAAAFATLCALAVGLQMRNTNKPGDAAPADAVAASVPANGRVMGTMLDEDPEFYAWLASSDAQQVALE